MRNTHPWIRFLVWKDAFIMRNAAFLQRRPHRSFKPTRRRDYARSLALPGYWPLTAAVWRRLWRHKRLFGSLVLLYALTSVLMGGITNQAVYEQISTLINQSAGEVIQGTFGAIGRAGLLLMTAFTGQSGMGAEQQLYLGLATLLLWLITVWLLRDILAGGRPKLRDGLYNAGAPIVGMAVIVFIAVVQLIPVGLVALAYSALAGVGILKEGMGMFLFWIFAVSVITLVLYWMTTTFLALVIVMLPGMYPLRAMRAAGDLVVDRRLRILYRLLWGCLVALLGWALCMITVILLDTGIKNILPVLKYIPFVPLIASLVGTIMFVWMSAYVYLLYRRIVDDGASPA